MRFFCHQAESTPPLHLYQFMKGFSKTSMSTDPAFRMTVQDIFSIKDRGTVVTGRIESGTVTVGDEIRIQGKSSSKTATVNGVEIRRKVITHAQAGDDIGILLKDIDKEDVQQGDILAGSEVDVTWKT